MSGTVHCFACNSSLNYTDKLVGKTVRCPSCKNEISIPSSDDVDEYQLAPIEEPKPSPVSNSRSPQVGPRPTSQPTANLGLTQSPGVGTASSTKNNSQSFGLGEKQSVFRPPIVNFAVSFLGVFLGFCGGVATLIWLIGFGGNFAYLSLALILFAIALVAGYFLLINGCRKIVLYQNGLEIHSFTKRETFFWDKIVLATETQVHNGNPNVGLTRTYVEFRHFKFVNIDGKSFDINAGWVEDHESVAILIKKQLVRRGVEWLVVENF